MLSGFFRYLNDRFARFISFFSDFVDPFLDNLIDNGGDLLLNAAYNAVKMVANDPSLIGDDERRQAAFKSILEQLKDGGIAVASSAANSAIEIALQKYKADRAAGASEPGTGLDGQTDNAAGS